MYGSLCGYHSARHIGGHQHLCCVAVEGFERPRSRACSVGPRSCKQRRERFDWPDVQPHQLDTFCAKVDPVDTASGWEARAGLVGGSSVSCKVPQERCSANEWPVYYTLPGDKEYS